MPNKELKSQIAKAEARLDSLKANRRWQEVGSPLVQLNTDTEIINLYELLISIAKLVK